MCGTVICWASNPLLLGRFAHGQSCVELICARGRGSQRQGAANASYALKLLQSEGEVTIASTGKDASTGNLVTHQYRVEGPVMLFLTTTNYGASLLNTLNSTPIFLHLPDLSHCGKPVPFD